MFKTVRKILEEYRFESFVRRDIELSKSIQSAEFFVENWAKVFGKEANDDNQKRYLETQQRLKAEQEAQAAFRARFPAQYLERYNELMPKVLKTEGVHEISLFDVHNRQGNQDVESILYPNIIWRQISNTTWGRFVCILQRSSQSDKVQDYCTDYYKRFILSEQRRFQAIRTAYIRKVSVNERVYNQIASRGMFGGSLGMRDYLSRMKKYEKYRSAIELDAYQSAIIIEAMLIKNELWKKRNASRERWSACERFVKKALGITLLEKKLEAFIRKYMPILENVENKTSASNKVESQQQTVYSTEKKVQQPKADKVVQPQNGDCMPEHTPEKVGVHQDAHPVANGGRSMVG